MDAKITQLEILPEMLSSKSFLQTFRTELPHLEEISIRSQSVPQKENVEQSTLLAVVRARREASSASSALPLQRLRVWKEGSWLDKLEDVEAALALEDSRMAVD